MNNRAFIDSVLPEFYSKDFKLFRIAFLLKNIS